MRSAAKLVYHDVHAECSAYFQGIATRVMCYLPCLLPSVGRKGMGHTRTLHVPALTPGMRSMIGLQVPSSNPPVPTLGCPDRNIAVAAI